MGGGDDRTVSPATGAGAGAAADASLDPDPVADPGATATTAPSAPRPSVAMDPPVVEHRHRDIQGGVARASVFGASDGLVSNVSLILGVAGANTTGSFVRLAGIAGLVAGAVSMAAGEYVSMKAQTELFERELDLERREIHRNPHVETVELTQIYQSRGIDPDTARTMATEVMSDPDRALEAHAREELGIDPKSLGSPIRASASSFLAFSVGAIIPLIPWFITDGWPAIIASVVLAVIAAGMIGFALGTFTGRSRLFSAGRQILIATVAAGVTFGIGSLLGVSTA
jgi:VIT1/CCC1 family predicted Fe2+/Mn2+ transporter